MVAGGRRADRFVERRECCRVACPAVICGLRRACEGSRKAEGRQGVTSDLAPHDAE